jgi:AcrR family transcriptional regulator
MKSSRPKAPKTQPYDSPLRRSQAEFTRSVIVDAAYEMLKTTRPEALSYAELAAKSGVVAKTIHRHFSERADLVGAVARKALAGMLGPTMELPTTRAGQAEMIRKTHESLSADPGLLRVMMAAPVRGGVAAAGGIQKLAAIALGDALQAVPPKQRATACGVWEHFVSPFFWDQLAQVHGLPPERVTAAALVMIDLLIAALTRDPEMFDPKRPMPRRFREGE